MIVAKKILLMGSKRSGKTSIFSVIFEKLMPNETVYIEATSAITKNVIRNSRFVEYDVYDFPGLLDLSDKALVMNTLINAGAIVFVVDAQDNYTDLMLHVQRLFSLANEYCPDVQLHILVHKSDGLTDEQKIEIQCEIQNRVEDNIIDSSQNSSMSVSLHVTSIYDHSIYEAFSKIIQKLTPEYPVLENLLNSLVSKSGIEKTFLFDVVSKLHIATDSSPIEIQMYELCCDMLDLVVDISSIYNSTTPSSTVSTPLISESVSREIEAVSQSSFSFNSKSTSVIRFTNGMLLYLREVGRYLALVSIISEESFIRQDLIDKNIDSARAALSRITK